MKVSIAIKQHKVIAVTSPAQARSAVVTGVSVRSSVLLLEEPVPAAEFPVLVPPVVFVTNSEASLISSDWMTDSADICCPTPYVPSHVDSLVQWKPHVTPSVPPLEGVLVR